MTTQGPAKQKSYLSIWSLYQDEAPYMREWIEFHRLMGVERFFLYDHYSSDDHRAALAPYIEEGIVVHYDWPVDPGQAQATAHCLEHHRDDSRWIAFIDLDEFLFSPTGKKLPEVLAGYEQYPGVVVNVAVFGTSGHEKPPDGLVIENYLQRTDNPDVNGHKKSIVDPARVVRNRGGLWDFSEGESVNENMQPADGRVDPSSVSFSRLRINHYHTRSATEYERKVAKPRADRRGVRMVARQMRERVLTGLNEVHDDSLAAYAPAVRDALRQTEERWQQRHGSPAPDVDGRNAESQADAQAVGFARDVLAGVAVCAADGKAYPHVDLVEKALRMLSPPDVTRPDATGPE
jgi:hypothetical protein